MDFFGCLSRGFMEFPSPGPRFKDFRGFPGMELGIFRVAKSSGRGLQSNFSEPRRLCRCCQLGLLRKRQQALGPFVLSDRIHAADSSKKVADLDLPDE